MLEMVLGQLLQSEHSQQQSRQCCLGATCLLRLLQRKRLVTLTYLTAQGFDMRTSWLWPVNRTAPVLDSSSGQRFLSKAGAGFAKTCSFWVLEQLNQVSSPAIFCGTANVKQESPVNIIAQATRAMIGSLVNSLQPQQYSSKSATVSGAACNLLICVINAAMQQ